MPGAGLLAVRLVELAGAGRGLQTRWVHREKFTVRFDSETSLHLHLWIQRAVILSRALDRISGSPVKAR